MIRSMSWVPQGAPVIEEMQKSRVIERLEEIEIEEEDENMVQDDDHYAGASAAYEFDMLNYNEALGTFGVPIEYYEVDPHINKNEADDSEEEDDIVILKPDEFKIIIAQTEDDISHLEAWILKFDPTSKECHMYLDHECVLSAVPLCTAWLDCPIKGGEKGNFIAVGSMEPAIKIWDLDIMDEAQLYEVQPSALLGGIIAKKKKGEKNTIKYKDGSHTDSVLGLAWNKEYRNILASASADKLVKIWDVATETCNITMENHTDKVQAVAWNNFAPQVLLSGSSDHTIVMKDRRIPNSGYKWAVDADVKCLAWDPHTEHSFVVSLENGRVSGFDIRAASSNLSSDPKPSFTIHAHNKSVFSISYNPAVPNLLATGSMDKLVKLWDLSNQPSCVATHKPKAGALFSITFSEDSPFILAVGGSKGKLELWDLLTDDAIASKYGKYSRKAKPPPS